MRNVTITLDEDTVRWVRIQAAAGETSVSRLVGEILRERRLQDAEYQSAMARFLGREPESLNSAVAKYPDREDLYHRSVLRYTNVLVYARDRTEASKQRQAHDWLEFLLRTRQGRLSMQLLQEYYQVATRRLQPGLKPPVAQDDIRDLMAWEPAIVDAAVLEKAWCHM